MDSINLLEQLKELNKTLYSLDCQFIMKDYCSGTPRWKGYTEQCMRKGHGPFMISPRASCSTNLHVFANTEALQTFSFGVFMEATLHRLYWLRLWPLAIRSLSSPLTPLWRLRRLDQKFQSSNHMIGSPGNQLSHLGGVQKSHY